MIILFPLAMSFESRVSYYRKFIHLMAAIVIVATPYLAWDILATYRGDWSFNKKYLLGIRLVNLPLEEILFFLTVPFSSIFIYESLSVYMKERCLKINKFFFIAAGIFLIAASMIFTDKYYTFTVLLSSGVFMISAGIFYTGLLQSGLYWIFILLMHLPFMLVNYLLTSMPVVVYNPAAITGIRILTIPVEDFFYSFSMLSFYLWAYLLVRRKWQRQVV